MGSSAASLSTIPIYTASTSGSVPIRALSLDGGGVRGVLELTIIRAIEEIIGPKAMISSYLDLIAGTSAGAINATAIASGEKTADEILTIYKAHAAAAFPISTTRKVMNWVTRGAYGVVSDLVVNKYPRAGIDNLLDVFYGEHVMSDAVCDVFVPAFETSTSTPYVFPGGPVSKAHPELAKLKAKDVVGCSISAPTYYTPKQMEVAGKKLTFVDGGLVADDPAMVAASRALQIFQRPRTQYHLLSIGTGVVKDQGITYKQEKHWGQLGWAPRIVDCILTGTSDAELDDVRAIFGNDHVCRIEPALPYDIPLDDVSKIPEIEQVGIKYCADHEDEIRKEARVLTNE